MRYVRAQDKLPAELLEQIQSYVDGEYLYIPRKEENKRAWGEGTSSKKETASRNAEIFCQARSGVPVRELAERYFLSEKTIRRILLEQRRREGESP